MPFTYPMDPSPIDILLTGDGGNVTIVEGDQPSRDKGSPRSPRNDTHGSGVLIHNGTTSMGGNSNNVTIGGGNVEGRHPPFSFQGKDEMNTIVVSVLTGLIAALCIILVVLLMPFVRRSVRRRQAVDKKRIKKRYQTVDAWLITKPIIAHTANCQCSSVEPSLENVTSEKKKERDDDSNNEDRECMICMEEFRVGMAVSWSPKEENCRHVYHKECIREWLLRHMDCPYCRQVMLPIDGTDRRVSIPQLRVLAEERSKRFDTTNYCLEHGLVVGVKENHDGTKIKRKRSKRSSRKVSIGNEEEKDEEMGESFQDSKAGVSRELMVDDADDEDIALDEPPIPCLDEEDLDELIDESPQEGIVASGDDIYSPEAENDNDPSSSSPA